MSRREKTKDREKLSKKAERKREHKLVAREKRGQPRFDEHDHRNRNNNGHARRRR